MNFKKTFCSSPWFHMRITNSGKYEYCRWAHRNSNDAQHASIADTTPEEFFQSNMIPIRESMLRGDQLSGCSTCYKMEQHNKVSGRQKQLLKIGVRDDNFDKTLLSSPWKSMLSAETKLLPQDWQIDLGNFCNSSCVFCVPEFSSRVALEHKKLGIIDQLPPTSWCNDPVLMDKFIKTITQTPVLKYLHFIGGETLVTPAFKTILKHLVKSGVSDRVSIGFTTNLISWDQEVIDLLYQFENVNLGVSVECFDPLNDYVRWPSKIDHVVSTLHKWLAISKDRNWLVQIRTTPTFLTLNKLLTVYDFAWQNHVAVESCNFLDNPEFLKISVLPLEYRNAIIDDIESWLSARLTNSTKVLNIRNPTFVQDQITQDLNSYVNYLKNETDDSALLPRGVQYLKQMESLRNNSIIDYLPEYEELFRSAGY